VRSPDHTAVRIVLAPFPLFALYLGACYLLGDARRYASPGYAAARRLGRVLVEHGDPMNAWGIVFALGALALGTALWFGDNMLLAGAMFVGGLVYCFWACLFAMSAIGDPAAPANGPGVYGFIASVHFLACWWMVRRAAGQR